MKKVILGLSGGVDSAVAARLLQKEGYDVRGLYLDIGSPEAKADAIATAEFFGVELDILDISRELEEKVCRPFMESYLRGETPNPCIMCNPAVKFAAILQRADELGADYIATGHYAQITEHRGHLYLQNAVDSAKDQTYFLWMLTEENLRRTLFPLGGLTKAQVRQIAFEHGFVALSKKEESQDICFIPNNDYRTFLAAHGVSVPQGEYIDATGKILGMHQGFCHYTIGQRKGLGIALGSPKFVTKIDAATNRVTLGEREDLLTHFATIADVRIRDWSWLQESPQVMARIRYKSPAVEATLQPDLPSTAQRSTGEADLQAKGRSTAQRSTILFASPVWGVTPGQSLVIYKDNLVIGGGIIQ